MARGDPRAARHFPHQAIQFRLFLAGSRSRNRAVKNKQDLSLEAKAAIDGSSARRFAVRLGSDIDEIPGIVAFILAVAAACAPCQALNATNAGTAAAPSSGPAPTRIAKAKPKKAEQPPQQSYITFFWSKGAEGSSLFSVFREKVLLSVDGKPAGKLTQGEYMSIPVEPGHHAYGYERDAFSSEGETKREIDVPQGQSVYFEIIEKNEAGILHTMYPQQVAAEQAQAELTRLKTPLQTAPKQAVRERRSAWSAWSIGVRPPGWRQTRQEGRRAAASAAKLYYILLAQ